MAPPFEIDYDAADLICDALATSSKGLGTILRELNLSDRISPSLVYKWIQRDEGIRERYTRAKAEQARVMAEEISEIADNTQVGEIVTIKSDGTEEIKRADMIEHRKLRIESRKWLAAKLLPKVYGDKVQQQLTGADGAPLPAVMVQFVQPKTDADQG